MSVNWKDYFVNDLEELGLKIYRLRGPIPCESPDQIVISKVREFDSILFSLNGDFTDIITYPLENYHGRSFSEIKLI